MSVRRRGAVRFLCAGARNEDANGLSEDAVDVRVARRLLLIVDGAGLAEGLDVVRSFVARLLRVCLGAGMAAVADSESEDVDARDVVNVVEEL